MADKDQNEILNQELALDELEAVNGGTARGGANCTAAYYVGGCIATVEEGSSCWKNDYCELFSSRYRTTPDAECEESHYCS